MKTCIFSLFVLLATITAAQSDQKQPSPLPIQGDAVIIDEAPAELNDAVSRQWTAVFSPDGKMLAVSAGWDDPREAGELILWDVASKKVRLVRRQEAAVRCVAFSADGKFVAIGDFAGQVKLLDPRTGQFLVSFPRHRDIVNSIAFSPDNQTLVSGSFDGTIRFWDLAGKKLTQEFKVENEKVSSIAIAWHGARLAASTREGFVHVWNLVNRQKLYTVSVSKEIVETVMFAPDGKTLATGDWSGQLKLWDAATGKKLRDFQGSERMVGNVAFSPDGKTLASIDGAGKVTFWNPQTGERTLSWQAHQSSFNFGLGFSPDGKMLATSSFARGPRIWDPRTRALIADLENAGKTQQQPLLDMLEFAILGPQKDVPLQAGCQVTVRNKSDAVARGVKLTWSLLGPVVDGVPVETVVRAESGAQDWPTFSLKPGEPRTLPMACDVKSDGHYTFSFYLAGKQIGRAYLPVSPAPGKAPTEHLLPADPERPLLDMLSFSMDGPQKDGVLNQPVTYRLTVRNKTKSVAADVALKWLLIGPVPDDAGSGTWEGPRFPKSPVHDWQTITLKAGESRTLSLSITAPSAGRFGVQFLLGDKAAGYAIFNVLPAPAGKAQIENPPENAGKAQPSLSLLNMPGKGDADRFQKRFASPFQASMAQFMHLTAYRKVI